MIARLDDPAAAERFARWVLGLAVALYSALALWLTRGATFAYDEIIYFAGSRGFAPDQILEPNFGGHLTATTNVIYEASLRIFGASHLPIQLATTAGVVATAVLLFLLLRRWVGPLAALAAALAILFFGSAPTLWGSMIMWTHVTAFGLAALLAFDHGGRRGNAIACAMLVLAVLTLEAGLAFAVGIGAWALADRERRRELWVAAIPLAVYAGWWVWALQFDPESIATPSNLLLLPQSVADSLAAAAGGLLGLTVDITDGFATAPLDIGWGRPLAIAAAVLAALGIRRWGMRPPLWGALAYLAALELSIAIVLGSNRFPTSPRYAYVAAIGLLLVLAAAYRGWRPSRPVLVVLATLVAISLPPNIWLLRDKGQQVRADSAPLKASLAMVELGRESIGPGFTEFSTRGVDPGQYLSSVDRFGSPAFSIGEIATGPTSVREAADAALSEILQPALVPAPEERACSGEVEATGRELALPPGGGVLRVPAGGTLGLRRFADEPTIPLGALPPGAQVALPLAVDAASQPWLVSVDGGGELELCGPVETPIG